MSGDFCPRVSESVGLSPFQAAVTFLCSALIAAFVAAFSVVNAADALGLVQHQPIAKPLPIHDAIISCLQREGVLVYAVTDKGPPKVGQPVTAEMFAVVCVGEK